MWGRQRSTGCPSRPLRPRRPPNDQGHTDAARRLLVRGGPGPRPGEGTQTGPRPKKNAKRSDDSWSSGTLSSRHGVGLEDDTTPFRPLKVPSPTPDVRQGDDVPPHGTGAVFRGSPSKRDETREDWGPEVPQSSGANLISLFTRSSVLLPRPTVGDGV